MQKIAERSDWRKDYPGSTKRILLPGSFCSAKVPGQLGASGPVMSAIVTPAIGYECNRIKRLHCLSQIASLTDGQVRGSIGPVVKVHLTDVCCNEQ
jgi:hypothetical protein